MQVHLQAGITGVEHDNETSATWCNVAHLRSINDIFRNWTQVWKESLTVSASLITQTRYSKSVILQIGYN